MGTELLTIPVSHYCEKARWALERARVPFVERPSIQLLHYWDAWWRARTIFVPVLITPEGKLRDSTAILHYADRRGSAAPLFPPDADLARVTYWEDRFDTVLGVEARRWIYWVCLGYVSDAALVRFVSHGVPAWQRIATRYLLPLAKRYFRWRLQVTEAQVNAGLDQVRAVFSEVDSELADGRSYLVGGRFTAADLTFAALGALVLLPAGYGVPMLELDDIPSWAQATVKEFRETAAGRYALRLYEQERR
jgi:glutathione S-transferase